MSKNLAVVYESSIFNSKRKESPKSWLLKKRVFSLRFIGDKTRRSLKSEMPYFMGLQI
jgi:hypothetical protein